MLLRWSLLIKLSMLFMFTTWLIYKNTTPCSDTVVQSWRRALPPAQPYAYINLCANMRAVFPSLVLFEQLKNRNCSRGDHVLLLPESLNSMVGELFEEFGVRRMVYDDSHPLFPISYTVNHRSTLKRDQMLWQKLRAWNATNYKKVVLLDNDLLVMSKIDDLFDYNELSGVPQLYSGEKIMFWEPTVLDQFVPISEQGELNSINRLGLNGGVMVIEPGEESFEELLNSAKLLTNRTCCPSQEFLFRHYQNIGKFNRLPKEYNARKLHKLSLKRAQVQQIKLYHFVEKRKPWLMGRRESQSDPMARAWWLEAHIVDRILDLYAQTHVDAYALVTRIREAAIAPELGRHHHNED